MAIFRLEYCFFCFCVCVFCFMLLVSHFPFDNAIRGITLNLKAAKVHLLPEREQHRSILRELPCHTKLLSRPALINLAHFLSDGRETQRGRCFITSKGSCPSAFSTSHLNTEKEMALIMLSGMFGFGGMVSSISFIGDGGRCC